jgi:hypothetical protein
MSPTIDASRDYFDLALLPGVGAVLTVDPDEGEGTRVIRLQQTNARGRPPALPELVVRAIVRARNRGDTFQHIATRLNLVQVETAQGGQSWYPATIRAVLNSAPGKRIAAEEAEADDLISDEALKRAEEREPTR